MTNSIQRNLTDHNQQRLRSKNRALCIALFIMVLMLYTLAIVRLRGSF